MTLRYPGIAFDLDGTLVDLLDDFQDLLPLVRGAASASTGRRT
ncbi:MAG TPA: hypothetical protein VM534_08635 [Thermoanaerobaculia bacterium]|nr:hypothetical protein [Thermoanaerobaculia bacterium]